MTGFTQCHEDIPGIIWKGKENLISFETLAAHAAPMLWFSPDEINLYNESGDKQLPEAFPFESPGEQPIVYYKLRHVYGLDEKISIINPESVNAGLKLLNLQEVKAIDLDYYYYFEEETGPTSHLHDIESIALRIKVLEGIGCPDFNYAIAVTKVTGRAHGVDWYNNVLKVDAQTFFPLSILIEEGKHASCPDKNADGAYTPTYDVTERINDAWGIRDIITSGILVAGGFQSWMAKQRPESSILFPPFPEKSPFYEKFQKKFWGLIETSQYELRPYPSYKQLRADKIIDDKLNVFMKDKKPHDWPSISHVTGDGRVKHWIKENNSFRSISLAYRWDEAQRLSFAFPLLLFKNVEAPRTGGWIYNKVYLGDFNSIIIDSDFSFEKLLGHQITYSSSASRWIDTYIGMGYEIFDVDTDPKKTNYDPFFVSEVGVKIRLNITRSPLRLLRYLGTDFWGLRLGWKNVGFSPFKNSGFVIELGAGVF
ncbi:MAG: hypothetical protein ACI8P3_002897 [Saprospiraceae bacterium]